MTLTPQLSQLLPTLSKAERLTLLTETRRQLSFRRLFQYAPYQRQREFHAEGAAKRERLFMAGNQLGKTLSGAAEAAMHLTGLYPDWWTGRRWDRPIVCWAAGVTAESTRDTVQRLTLGRPGDFGIGFLPKANILDWTAGRGATGSVDTATIRHASGGVSRLGFKAYVQGREKWQGETLDLVWYDEEPPADIYTEGLTRTNATGGMVYMTFTPLLGVSEVVRRFLMEESRDRSVTKMTIDDVGHYTAEQKASIVASYPPHEREARAKGIPVLGSGRIFPVTEESIAVDAFDIPKRWRQIGGVDFGYDHPFAGARLAYDADADCIYVIATYRQREATPVIHSAALRGWGTWLPMAWPHDGLQHDKGSGDQLAAQYRAQGLNMLHERATFEDGTNGVEAGLSEMLSRMQTGRWKVFRHLNDWWEEFRLYHRKDGKVVKEHDDLLSASRYAMMMLRHADLDGGGFVKLAYNNRGII